MKKQSGFLFLCLLFLIFFPKISLTDTEGVAFSPRYIEQAYTKGCGYFFTPMVCLKNHYTIIEVCRMENGAIMMRKEY